jgi:hypothetical protein
MVGTPTLGAGDVQAAVKEVDLRRKAGGAGFSDVEPRHFGFEHGHRCGHDLLNVTNVSAVRGDYHLGRSPLNEM